MKNGATQTSYTTSQLATWQLMRTKGVGPIAYKKLLSLCHNNPLTALEQFEELAKAKGRTAKLAPMKSIEAELATLENHGGTAIFLQDPTYPYLLSHCKDCPPMLQILGDATLLKQEGYAIVGGRNASAHSLKFTRELAASLASSGANIVSGLARGIDTAAHSGALASNGLTVAVVAGGVDHIYPPENKELRKKILTSGCIVSENPIGMQPTNRHFPRRNRIIAGLTRATLVVEATRRSGSLITATYAGEYGRDVYAVPGSPMEPRAEGGNHLLKQGASLLENAEDVLTGTPLNRAYTPQPTTVYTGEDFTPSLFQTPVTVMEEPENNTLLTLLSTTPMPLDVLIRQSGRSEAEILIELTELELCGQAKRHQNGEISRA